MVKYTHQDNIYIHSGNVRAVGKLKDLLKCEINEILHSVRAFQMNIIRITIAKNYQMGASYMYMDMTSGMSLKVTSCRS